MKTSKLRSDAEAGNPPPVTSATMPHEIEHAVQRKLRSLNTAEFRSLVVRRISDGVCLEGIVEYEGDCPDIADIVKSVDGVQQVLNHLVSRRVPR